MVDVKRNFRFFIDSRGRVPVAVLTDGFNATDINDSTVFFAGAHAVHSTVEDVDGDGAEDMIFHFLTQELNLDENSVEALLLERAVGAKSPNRPLKEKTHTGTPTGPLYR